MLIPFAYLFQKYNIKANGVLHIGAHLGQEYQAYKEQGIQNIIFVEANEQTYRELTNRVDAKCLHACITDKDGDTVTFNVSNNEGQSSSILAFGTHTREHPGIVFTSTLTMKTSRVDTLLKANLIETPNFVNIDIQGAELLALKGMDLSKVNYLYLEVNTRELYKGCALLPELDAFLSDFVRVETKMTPHGWGDAFYIRRTQTTLVVPDKFQPPHPIKYPPDNDPDFEKWYMQNYTGHEGRIYLPVMWTAYYCKHKYGADHTALEQLQKFLNSLDRTAKYYTVVQYDDGILNDVSHLDLKVFSMSGKGDYYLPLICKEHSFRHVRHSRSIFANFIGRNTHEIRREIFNIRKPGWHIEQKSHKLEVFCGILANSTFTLCPRGYGPTSFRIAEAMQYGSIPVYISDQFIDPHGINFNEYGIKVWPHQLHNLEAILNAVNVAEKQQAIKEYYPKYFTYDANKRIIRQEAGR